MTALPSWFEAEFDENGRLLVSDEAAARLSAQLGHHPRPGDKVLLALVDDDDADDEAEVERWLRSEVVASIQDMRAHPEHNRSIDQVREHFAAKFSATQPTEKE